MLGVALIVAVVAAVRGMWSPCGLSMLSSLNPVSERARGNRFWLTALWYIAGAATGGAVLGVGCALAAAGYGRIGVPDEVTWSLVLLGAFVAVVSDTGALGRSLPEHPRQVDERWLVKYRRWIYAGGYGAQIGVGFATYIMTAAVYLVALLAVLTGSAAAAFVLCLTFGAVRGLTIVVSATARTPDRLRSAHRRIAALAGASLAACIGISAAVAVFAGYLVGGTVVAALAFAVAGVCVLRPRLASSRGTPVSAGWPGRRPR